MAFYSLLFFNRKNQIMKKITFLFVFILLLTNLQAYSLTFEEALYSQKPCAVLLYANWAEELNAVSSSFDKMAEKYNNKYNFLKIDIANPLAKKYNEKYVIERNLPYAVLYKDRGRFSRKIERNCLIDNSCFKDRLEIFVN